MLSPEDLTPAEREAAQLVLLRIWLARRVPKGTKRRTDHRLVQVQRFDMAGNVAGTVRVVPPISGDGRVAACRAMAAAARRGPR